MYKHEPKFLETYDLFGCICKYCDRDLVFDCIAQEYILYFMHEECISDDEKVIKDLLE